MLRRVLFYRMGTVEKSLRERLSIALQPKLLQVVNQSKRHSRGEQTHFNLLIVSDKFRDLSTVKQHKLVYSAAGELMKQIHALTITCHTEIPEDSQAWSLGCFHKHK